MDDANDYIAVLIDPATKPFAEWLLGRDLCRDTTNLSTEEEASRSLQGPKGERRASSGHGFGGS